MIDLPCGGGRSLRTCTPVEPTALTASQAAHSLPPPPTHTPAHAGPSTELPTITIVYDFEAPFSDCPVAFVEPVTAASKFKVSASARFYYLQLPVCMAQPTCLPVVDACMWRPARGCFNFSAVQGVAGRGWGWPQVPPNACMQACALCQRQRAGVCLWPAPRQAQARWLARLVRLRSAVLSVGVQVPLKGFIRMDKQRASATL